MPGAQLVPVNLRGARALALEAWAVRIGHRQLNVLLTNRGNRRIRVRPTLPATASASLERMLAPSVTSSAGVTLAGQSLGPDAMWSSNKQTEVVAPYADHYAATLSPNSAALLSVRVAASFAR